MTTVRIEAGNEEGSYRICGALTAHTVSRAHEALVELAQQRADARIDLSAVEELDTAGMQLLVSFKRAQPGSILHSLPSAQRRLCELVGLAPHIF